MATQLCSDRATAGATIGLRHDADCRTVSPLDPPNRSRHAGGEPDGLSRHSGLKLRRITKESDQMDATSPAPTPPLRSPTYGFEWIAAAVLFTLTVWSLRSSIAQVAPRPVLEIRGLDWAQTGEVEEIVFTARVNNEGGTGAVTLYAYLRTDSGRWEQRETVVIPKFHGEDFRFVFRGWTGTNPAYSLSLAADHWSQDSRRVAVPLHAKRIRPQ